MDERACRDRLLALARGNPGFKVMLQAVVNQELEERMLQDEHIVTVEAPDGTVIKVLKGTDTRELAERIYRQEDPPPLHFVVWRNRYRHPRPKAFGGMYDAPPVMMNEIARKEGAEVFP